VAQYLVHRMAVAAVDDCTDTHVFEPVAVQAIAQWSRGVPRLVNVLAHKALLLAFGEGTHRVNVTHVRLAAADTPGVRGWHGRWRWHWPRWLGGRGRMT